MEFFNDSLISGFSAHGFQLPVMIYRLELTDIAGSSLPSLFFMNETRKMSTGTKIDVTKLMNKPGECELQSNQRRSYSVVSPSTATVEVPWAFWWGRSDLYQTT